MGKIKNIDFKKRIFELQLPDMCQLVLMGEKNLNWDPKRKGSNLKVNYNSQSLLLLSNGKIIVINLSCVLDYQ